MKRWMLVFVADMLILLFCVIVNAQELIKGENRIDVPARGEGLCVNNLFQSNMILQRDKPIGIWGWAEAGRSVTVSFGDNQETTETTAEGTWKVVLPAQPANAEPRDITITSGEQTLILKNVLVGDVWLCGGQSNMEFEIAKVVGGGLEIVSANFPQIRLLTVPQQEGPEIKHAFPLMHKWIGFFNRHYRQGAWDVCTPDNVKEFSAIGYVFARRLYMATQVPIGMIDVSRGGTCVETWTPLAVLEEMDSKEVTTMLSDWNTKIKAFDPEKDLAERIAHYNGRTERLRKSGADVSNRTPPTEVRSNPHIDNMNRPGNCYASMMAPLEGLAIKGAIWHQGFNNALQPNGHVMYGQVFPKMIESWRKLFNDPEMPFGIISLCTAGAPQDLDNYVEQMADEGVYIREVQYKTYVEMTKAGDKSIGFASSYDQRRSWYHPQIKVPVGERIARWALATQYGLARQIKWQPPSYKEMVAEDGAILLKGCDQMGAYYDGPILGFSIAGEEGRFQPATAEYLETGKDNRGRTTFDRSVIRLSSPLVPQPVHFRYAWGRNPLANLKASNNDDIPFATQRSDDWTLPDLYERYTGEKTAEPGVVSRGERNAFRKALKAEDQRRLVAEAEQLLETVDNENLK
jgi:sialate O-acetylesterase